MKQSTKNRVKRGTDSFIINLLQTVQGLGVFVPEPFESKYEHQKRIRMVMRDYSPARIDRGLYYLNQKGLIDKKKVNQINTYALTISGKQKLLLSKISRSKWSPRDGYSCIVIFDIPEAKRKHRRFIRRFLLNNGFINLQKSVMIGPEFLSKEFLELLDEWKLRQNVTIIKGQVLYL